MIYGILGPVGHTGTVFNAVLLSQYKYASTKPAITLCTVYQGLHPPFRSKPRVLDFALCHFSKNGILVGNGAYITCFPCLLASCQFINDIIYSFFKFIFPVEYTSWRRPKYNAPVYGPINPPFPSAINRIFNRQPGIFVKAI